MLARAGITKDKLGAYSMLEIEAIIILETRKEENDHEFKKALLKSMGGTK